MAKEPVMARFRRGLARQKLLQATAPLGGFLSFGPRY